MSRYPVLVEDRDAEIGSPDDVVVAIQGAEGELPESFTKLRGSGEVMDLGPIVEAVAAVEDVRQDPRWRDELRENKKDLDDFHSAAAKAFHHPMSRLDAQALGDPDFWKWLALGRMWELTLWRYHHPAAPLRRDWFGLDNATWRNLPLGLFLRLELASRAAESSDGGYDHEYFLSGVLSIDLWQSHLFAVDTGFAPGLTAALLHARLDPKGALHGEGKSGQIKAAGRNVTFLRRTLLVEGLDMQGASAVVSGALDIE